MVHAPAVPRRIVIAAALLAAVIVLGTAGYMTIQHWGFFDAFYMTITTLTTIGGGEASPLSVAGKVWTLAVVMVGFGVLTYTLLALVGYALEGQLGIAVGRGRIARALARMTDHFILCGYGRVGREIAREFTEEGMPFVIIDNNADSLARAANEGYMIVNGNASEVETLKAARIERSRGLVTAVDNDADNIYVTLSARVLRPDLFIVARANRADSEPKLRLAGANRIISPYTIGGRRMASLAMRPTAVEFVDTVLSAGKSELMLEDFTVPAGSSWIGQTLGALVRDVADAIVLAVKRGETMIFRPPESTVLEAGDELVAAGPPSNIRTIERRITAAR